MIAYSKIAGVVTCDQCNRSEDCSWDNGTVAEDIGTIEEKLFESLGWEDDCGELTCNECLIDRQGEMTREEWVEEEAHQYRKLMQEGGEK